ncbi:predicted protein [Botrytis cinerea T4]|uniref:Uncharacterized protein n=1 Tax=Botryotinia fuckeliana (strain T4) TaxID=999810 RepID=G2Y1P7_BOTF4|nr:predicted protein [Botrytis cinerea T4]
MHVSVQIDAQGRCVMANLCPRRLQKPRHHYLKEKQEKKERKNSSFQVKFLVAASN